MSVRGPQGELPVRISGDVQSGFTAEFTPTSVGAHTINVEYNGYAVQVKAIAAFAKLKQLWSSKLPHSIYGITYTYRVFLANRVTGSVDFELKKKKYET